MAQGEEEGGQHTELICLGEVQAWQLFSKKSHHND